MTSFAVTLYHLILGAQDSTTGQYQRGYTRLSATMVIMPPGKGVVISGHGIYAGKNAVGVTNAEVEEGDIVKDSFGLTYRVVGVRPNPWGDTFVFNICDLQEIAGIDVRIPTSGAPPISDPKFFGFEDSGASQKFEDGFERGYFV